MSVRSTVKILLVFLTLIVATCTSTTGPGAAGPPWIPPDSAWEVVENLEYAYNTMDLGLYMSCFRDDFVFHLAPIWPQSPDTTWGIEVEEQFHQSMFYFVYDIDLTLSGSAGWPWSGDSTGQSWELQRIFDLKVYYVIPGSPSEEAEASGSAMFICRPDSADDWYIWQWWDCSEQSDSLITWTEIKSMF